MTGPVGAIASPFQHAVHAITASAASALRGPHGADEAPTDTAEGLDVWMSAAWVDPALDWVSALLLALGCFLVLTGALGVIRMPDVYSRMHPAGKGDTLGQSLILVGLALQVTDPFLAGKLILIIIAFWITAPTATHALAKAAWDQGLRPVLGEDAREAVRRSEGRKDAA